MPATRKRRTRSKAPPSNQVVAPGGGTQTDVDKLASNLGLESSSVADILNCEGSGVAPVRRTRNGTNAGADGDDDKPVMSAAWSDFMTEEGYEAGDKKTTTKDAKDTNKSEDNTEEGKEAKRAKTDAAAQESKAAKTSSSSTTTTTTTKKKIHPDDMPRIYELPLRPLMRPPSERANVNSTHKYPTPGLLAQTGTLDSTIVGRAKRPLTEVQDLQEPNLFTSTFSKKVAFVASAPTAVHSICILTDGSAYAWGRNEAGQCGFGSTSNCIPLPKKIELEGKFIGAAVGKSHSILIEEGGVAYAVGLNKYGQCGVNSNTDGILNWKKCVLGGLDSDETGEVESPKIVQVGCFTYLIVSITLVIPILSHPLSFCVFPFRHPAEKTLPSY